MASVAVPGNGTTTIETATPTAGLHRQYMVVADPITPANVALVSNSGLLTSNQSIAKGTQGSTGVTTQDLKDSGRTLKIYSGTFTAAATEALVTLTPISAGTAGTTGTSFAIGASKIFRITSISVSVRNAAAATQGVVCQLRMTSTGAIATTSPLIGTCAAGTGSAIAGVANSNQVAFPDGLELSGTMQFGISQVGSATANNTVVLYGYEY